MSTATVTVNVSDVNLLPDAVDDSFDINENSPLSGSLLGNDDLGDNPTTVTAFDNASTNGGTVNVNPDGTFSYTPATDFVGADTFTYTITDADGDMSTATVTVNVANVNVPPVAADDEFRVHDGDGDVSNSSDIVSGNVISHNDGDGIKDTDGGDGAALTVTQVSGVDLDFAADGYATLSIIDGVITAFNPVNLGSLVFDGEKDNGILRINADGEFTYENKGFSVVDGVESVVNFTYTLSDGTDTDTATVAIEVIDNGPDAISDSNYIELTEFFTTDTYYANNIEGNVIIAKSSGDNSDFRDSDDVTAPTLIQVQYDGVVHDFGANTSITINTDFGTLSIQNTGRYEFSTPFGMKLPDDIDLHFTYTIQDGDTVNPETDSADLTIYIRESGQPNPVITGTSTEVVTEVATFSAGGTIDTDIDSKSLINADKATFKFSPDIADLGDILTDGHTDGLESYLAAMGEDESAIVDIDLAAASKDSLVEAAVLAKGQNDSDHGSYATVTNGLLEGGGTIISDQAAATNAPIAEFDSAELL